MTAPRDYAAEALRSVVQPTFAPGVAEIIRRHLELAGGGLLECVFCCGWNPETEAIISAEIRTRGSGKAVFDLDSDFEAGQVSLHNHTFAATTLAPSAEDLESATTRAKWGIGSAICDPDVRELVVIRPPRAVRPRPTWRGKTWEVGAPELTKPEQLVEALAALTREVGPVSVTASWEPRR